MFFRAPGGEWRVRWLHLHLAGEPEFNAVENNQVSATALARALVDRRYLTVGYLAGLLADDVIRWDGQTFEEPVTFIGLERPEGLPEGSRVFTPENLGDLIPA